MSLPYYPELIQCCNTDFSLRDLCQIPHKQGKQHPFWIRLGILVLFLCQKHLTGSHGLIFMPVLLSIMGPTVSHSDQVQQISNEDQVSTNECVETPDGEKAGPNKVPESAPKVPVP